MNALKKQTVINVLLTVLLLVVGIGLIVGASFMKKGNDKKISEWTHTQGVVVDYTYTEDFDDDIMYSEIVEYKVGEKSYRIKSSSSSNIRPKTGAKREVAYNPANPENAIIVSENRTMTTIMFIVGGVFTAVGVLMIGSLVFRARKGKNAPVIESAPEEPTGNEEIGQSEAPGRSGRYVFTGSAPSTPPSQPVQPTDENPFEEFETKDR